MASRWRRPMRPSRTRTRTSAVSSSPWPSRHSRVLAVGMLLVTLILVAFLGDYRAALIAAVNVPLALLIAFCGMVLSRTSANLISLGAVDFGIVVDAPVIMMENVVHHLARRDEHS